MDRRHILGATVLVAILAACSPSTLMGGETLTLDEALTIALERNLVLKATHEDYESAKWGLRSARASLFPSVSLSSTARRVDPETFRRANASLDFLEELEIEVEPFLYETTYETSFSVTVPIWNGGRLWGAVGAAGAGRDAAAHAYESTRRAVDVDTKAAYFGVLRAEALHAVVLDAVEAAGRNVAAAERKVEIGLVPRVELLRWRVEHANNMRELADAERALVLARTNLAHVLGLPLDAEFELAGVDRRDLDGIERSFAWLLEPSALTEERARRLLAANPDFLAIADATRASRSGMTIARGAFFPALNAQGSYGWKADDDIDPDDDTAWSVALALELPIFTSFKNFSDYQQSKRSYLAAARRQEDLERSMIAGLRNVVATIRASMKALDAATTLVDQAEEHLKNVTNRHDQGMAPYTELVDARVLYDRSRAGLVNAAHDAFLAFAEAERLLGSDADAISGEIQ